MLASAHNKVKQAENAMMSAGLAAFIAKWSWAFFTICASAAQTARNAMQRDLTRTLGTAGATHVRFLFALPFAVVSPS